MKNSCNNTCQKCSSYVSPGAFCTSCLGEACEEIYYSSCVIYTGNYLECYGIESGDNLTTVINKLLEAVYENHTTTTTTLPVTSTTTTLFKLCDDCP